MQRTVCNGNADDDDAPDVALAGAYEKPSSREPMMVSQPECAGNADGCQGIEGRFGLKSAPQSTFAPTITSLSLSLSSAPPKFVPFWLGCGTVEALPALVGSTRIIRIRLRFILYIQLGAPYRYS